MMILNETWESASDGMVKACNQYVKEHRIDSIPVERGTFLPTKDNDMILMQYTGVHDQSEEEKEIYEGDKVKFRYESTEYIGIVKFEAGTFILGCLDLVDSYITLLEIVDNNEDYYWLDGEVIGNIYEN
jgi:uncharacterized phage protein (TIGR01671 family)